MKKIVLGSVLAFASSFGNKTPGRRNYAIVIYDDKFFCGNFGRLKEKGYFSWRLSDMAQHNILIINYTYKRDFQHDCAMLEEAGMIKRIA